LIRGSFIKSTLSSMSRVTDPMLLARDPAAKSAPPEGVGGDFWSRMKASGVKVTRASSPAPGGSVEASLEEVEADLGQP
jgi:hypothetical protein